MTEDEAKTTRCCGPEGCGEYRPEPRMIYQESRSGEKNNIMPLPGQPRFCIGPACMAWRWHGFNLDDDGYCGLAGAP